MDFGVIVPNPAMRDQVERLRGRISVSFVVEVSDIDRGPEAARRLVAHGAKALVSRSGVGNAILASGYHGPFVEIPVSGFDVARLLGRVGQEERRIAVIAANTDLAGGIEEIAPLFGIETTVFPIRAVADIDVSLDEAQRLGLRLAIGGTTVIEHARSRPIRVMQVSSSDNILLKSLREAERVVLALRAEREVAMRRELMLNAIPEAVISFGTDGDILHHNRPADPLVKRGAFVRQSGLSDAVRAGKGWSGEIRAHGTEQYACLLTPVVLDGENRGAVAVLHDVGKLQRLERKVRKKLYRLGHVARYTLDDIVGASPSLRRVIGLTRKYAASASTVLIQGESGTGKELFAQSVHLESPRRTGPFVAINCTSLPESLLESELFGYAEGAFTGARKGGRPGLFEIAHQGSLFLDEIGEIPPSVQARLLRVLEEKTVRRIGEEAIIPIDVRVICATNRDLAGLVREGRFREDLYYRLNVLRLEVPPLRGRPEDIPRLIDHFLESLPPMVKRPPLRLEKEARRLLTEYAYPGNVREMRNILERLLITADGDTIRAEDVCLVLGEASDRSRSPAAALPPRLCGDPGLLAREEMAIILRTINECGNNKTEAARRLGISPATLWRRLGRLHR